MMVHSKAVDDENPLPPIQKPRGYGGVAILYSRRISNCVKKLPAGGHRVVAIEVATTPPLCVCCLYMPSRNTKNILDKDNYQHILDQIEDILNIFSKTHAVIVLGDLNASLCQRKNNMQDTLLRNFVHSNDLHSEQTGAETFFYPNKTDKAEIDYILLNTHSKQLVKTVKVDSSSALNTPDHVQVIGTYSIHKKEKGNQTITVMCKPKWNQCNKAIYRDTVRETLLPFETSSIPQH